MSNEEAVFKNISAEYEKITAELANARKKLTTGDEKKVRAEHVYRIAKQRKSAADKAFAIGRISEKEFKAAKEHFLQNQKRLLEINKLNRDFVRTVESEIERLVKKQKELSVKFNGARFAVLESRVVAEAKQIRSSACQPLLRAYAMRQLTGAHQTFGAFLVEVFGSQDAIRDELHTIKLKVTEEFGEAKQTW